MELPIINKLSGTEPSDLLKDYNVARKAVEEAIRALSAVWPNGRDYQGGSINNAMHEHAERCRALRQVYHELQVIIDGIGDQIL